MSQALLMDNLAFIVEGSTEKLFIENVCPTSPVKFIGANGVDVKISAIADRVITQMNLLRKRAGHFVVIFDRETRTESARDLHEDLKKILMENGKDSATFTIGIADRSVENWILSDSANIRRLGNDSNYYYTHEGKKCVGLIKRMYPGYHKTNNAPSLLKSGCPSRMKASASFASFFDELSLKGVNCWWFEKADNA